MVTAQYASENELRKALLDEIVRAVGLPVSDFWRKFVEVVCWVPISRFSQIGSHFDKLTFQYGFTKAIDICLKIFITDLESYGHETIPSEGPLLVVSNHPGTYDALCLAAKLPRDDIKIVSSNIPFIKKMKNVNDHFLFASVDKYVRMLVIRNSIRHLENGGALIIFPSAHMDPEPSCMSGAMEALDEWSKSLEIFVKKVPETNVQVGVVSRVLSDRYINRPLTRVRKGQRERQRIAEFIQVINQMIFKKQHNMVPLVTFAPHFKLADISPSNNIDDLLPYAISQAKVLMEKHIKD